MTCIPSIAITFGDNAEDVYDTLKSSYPPIDSALQVSIGD